MIIDRRTLGIPKSIENRKRFLDKARIKLKQKLDGLKVRGSVVDKQDIKIKIKDTDLVESTFEYDTEVSIQPYILTHNKRYRVGDFIPIHQQPQSGGSGGGAGSGDGDEIEFTLTHQEVLDLYFKDLELPDFLKKSIAQSAAHEKESAGYTRKGVPSKLDIRKTFQHAVARRLCNKNGPYIDDIDLHYRHYRVVEKPDKAAVVFAIMDVSGSMNDNYKQIVKKFFFFLYFFLTKFYKNVKVEFIIHTEEAYLVDEHTFFNSTLSGGTSITKAFELAYKKQQASYSVDDYNIYYVYGSDGETTGKDQDALITLIRNKIMPVIQYFIYIETSEDVDHPTLYTHFLSYLRGAIKCTRISYLEEVSQKFYQIFKRRTS